MLSEELTGLLKQVSRSFYLTLRVLPRAIRPQIGLAYLLARATDTIADTEIVPVAERLAALGALRRRILGLSEEPLDFSRWVIGPNQDSGAINSDNPTRTVTDRDPTVVGQGALGEQRLLRTIEAAVRCLNDLTPADLQRVREVLSVITAGQELDLRRFGSVPRGSVVALETEDDLLDYTYRVAGCVGEFWTRMCRAHLFPDAPLDEDWLLSRGIRFGQGLQLVNILRDLPADLLMGRCYLPRQSLAEMGILPAELLQTKNEDRLRALYDQWLNRAERFLADGWDYTCALPSGCRRVRLACAWPVLIGVQTLERLRSPGILDPARRIKVSRRQVRTILWASLVRYPWSSWWQKLFNDMHHPV